MILSQTTLYIFSTGNIALRESLRACCGKLITMKFVLRRKETQPVLWPAALEWEW
jgi:hypothetical protein